MTTLYTIYPDEGIPDGAIAKTYERYPYALKYAHKLLDSVDSGQVTITHGDTIEYLYRVDGGTVKHEID